MSNQGFRSISNSFQDVRLVSLSQWNKAAEITPRDANGPYVVLQEGYDPADPTVAPHEFILGRSGQWLALGLFYHLPVEDRRTEFVFGTAGEVIKILGELTSKVKVFPIDPNRLIASSEPAQDDLAAAVASSARPPGAR